MQAKLDLEMNSLNKIKSLRFVDHK